MCRWDGDLVVILANVLSPEGRKYAMKWLSAELNEEINQIELWNVNFEKVSVLNPGDLIQVFTRDGVQEYTLVHRGQEWAIQPRNLNQKHPIISFPKPPYGLIINH